MIWINQDYFMMEIEFMELPGIGCSAKQLFSRSSERIQEAGNIEKCDSCVDGRMYSC